MNWNKSTIHNIWLFIIFSYFSNVAKGTSCSSRQQLLDQTLRYVNSTWFSLHSLHFLSNLALSLSTRTCHFISKSYRGKNAKEGDLAYSSVFCFTFYQKKRIVPPPWTSPVEYYLSPKPDVYWSTLTFIAHSRSLWKDSHSLWKTVTESAHLALISLPPRSPRPNQYNVNPREMCTWTHT